MDCENKYYQYSASALKQLKEYYDFLIADIEVKLTSEEINDYKQLREALELSKCSTWKIVNGLWIAD